MYYLALEVLKRDIPLLTQYFIVIRMTADPSQGSDIERIQRAQVILEEAKAQPQQVLNLRQAYLEWLEVMRTPNIEELAPEPDPDARDPMQDLMMAQQAAEMEMRKQDQALRSQEVELKRMKLAQEAAKEMTAMGLQADKQEAEITNLYSQALERLVNSGIASGREALEAAQNIENTFIEGDKVGRQTQTIDSSAVERIT